MVRDPKRDFWMRIAHHSALIAGCVIFLIPFLSMLMTSFKQEDELFEKNLLPRLPGKTVMSPYLDTTVYPEPNRPDRVSRASWKAVRKGLGVRIIPRAMELVDRRMDIPPGDAIAPIERGLIQTVLRRFPEAGWSQSPVVIVEKMEELLRPKDVNAVFEEVRRSVRIGHLHVFDQDMNEFRVGGVNGALAGWTIANDDIENVALLAAETKPIPSRELQYDCSSGNQVTIENTIDLPFEPKDLKRIVLPIKGDKSWYPVGIQLRLGDSNFRSERPRRLRSGRWQEFIWQFPGPDDEAEGYKEYIRLKDHRELPATNIGKPTNRIRVTFRFESGVETSQAKLASNYNDTFERIPFWRYLFNSVLLVLLNVFGALVSCSLVAYAFARLEWPGRDILFVILLATMMLPAQVTMVPVFLIFKALGWHNTLKPLFVGSFFGNAFFIFLLRQFMKSIPKDLEKAARIDGCGFFGVYWHVILPLTKPALAAVAIFQFQWSWNEFMAPLIYLNSEKLYPLALGLFEFKAQYGGEYGMMMAASLLMTLPIIAVFLVAQRYFIQGVTLTGIKG